MIQESHTDELTGVKNYKALKKDFDNLLELSKTEGTPITLILIDVDNFKTFNNENSYEIADEVLAKLG